VVFDGSLNVSDLGVDLSFSGVVFSVVNLMVSLVVFLGVLLVVFLGMLLVVFLGMFLNVFDDLLDMLLNLLGMFLD